jgi:chromate transporter
VEAADAGAAPPAQRDVVPFREAVRAWFAISLQTFGGPAGQIAVMQRALVDERRWIGQRRFLHALNYCMMLPGPEAQQLAIYVGWLLNGVRGGLVAGTLFVLPGVAALLALSVAYVEFREYKTVDGLFAGVAAGVVAIVAQAVVRVGGRALGHPVLVAVAVLAFLGLIGLAAPFPLVIAAAALAGLLLARWRPAIVASRHADADAGPPPLVADDALHHERPSARRSARILAVGLALWAAPVIAAAMLTGPSSVFTDQALFFSGTAVVTFGGAYAVLAFVAQQAVQTYHWLSAADMVRGLALAESTPGPLIMVVQFVAFLGAYHAPGTGMPPLVAGTIAALLTTWVTFVPCFLFIFLGAPSIERLRGNRALAAALTGITAAVVGVIASLAVYFALHTFFAGTRQLELGPLALEAPQLATIRPVSVLIAAVAAFLLIGRRWSAPRVLIVGAALGLVATLAGYA